MVVLGCPTDTLTDTRAPLPAAVAPLGGDAKHARLALRRLHDSPAVVLVEGDTAP